MVLVVAAALLTASIILVVKQRWWGLLIGTVLMLVGSAVPIPVPSGAITNAFELILLITILLTIGRQDTIVRRDASALFRE